MGPGRDNCLGPSLPVEALMGGRACVVRALPPAFRGRVLGAQAGGNAVCVHGECVQGVPSFQERDGGSLPHTLLFFVQDFPLLRPAYVWDMCGTPVGHVRAAILTILYLCEYGVRGECTGSAIVSGKGWGWSLPCTPKFCRTFLCCGLPACGTRESSHLQLCLYFSYSFGPARV